MSAWRFVAAPSQPSRIDYMSKWKQTMESNRVRLINEYRELSAEGLLGSDIEELFNRRLSDPGSRRRRRRRLRRGRRPRAACPLPRPLKPSGCLYIVHPDA
ncbi:hypothetical protein EVAR_66030_1 [Eumeta japonica]|uniref:Uncharacterized protein n=1 Tax=Eumeta variegata TaxID=151549 RepID=A0A4C1Z861_EUMVA|nr:hypothetical protein EVAR_66030_1 [Eumeta japonica]